MSTTSFVSFRRLFATQLLLLLLVAYPQIDGIKAQCVPPSSVSNDPVVAEPVCQGKSLVAYIAVTIGCLGSYEFEVSRDGGLTWNTIPVTPTGQGTVSTTTSTVDDDVYIRGRLCPPGISCESTQWIPLVHWVYSNLSADITHSPDPLIGCFNDIVLFDGNPKNGYQNYSHQWTGSGAAYLSSTSVPSPTFQANAPGDFTLIYTVTDDSECSATSRLEFSIQDTIKPEISCPRNFTVSTDTDSCNAVVCYSIESDDNCPIILPESIAGTTYLGSHNGHSYFLGSGAGLTWELANQQAANAGGHLVTLTNSSEIGHILDELPVGKYWLGAVYSPSEGEMKWVNGETFDYEAFAIEQPDLEAGHYVYTEIISNTPPVKTEKGWYSGTPSDVFHFIIEVDNGQHRLLNGPASGATLPLGTFTVSYVASDEDENTASCSFTITVEDNQDPEITCPDDIEIDLNPLLCGIEVEYELPEFSDNCPGAFLFYSPGDKISGSYFPIGVHDIQFTVMDLSNNSVSCTFTITVNDYVAPPLGCKDVQISLDSECYGQITPTMVLAGWQGPENEVLLGCLDFYTIEVTDKNGYNLGDEVGFDQLNETLQYMITHTSGFTCWADIHIEDKIAPVIFCKNDTVPCLTDVSKLQRVERVLENCDYTVSMVDETHTLFECDELFVGKVVSYWKAIDISGNESGICSSTVYLERPRVGEVGLDRNFILGCSDGFAEDDKGNGYPHPFVAGVPYIGEKALYPVSQLDMLYCNSTIDYDDELVFESKCKKKIRRTWKIYEWWCSTAVIHFLGDQMIEIRDDEAPVIPQQPDVTITTETRSCSAKVTLPALDIKDNCNDIYKVHVNITKGEDSHAFVNGNGGAVELPTGTSTIEYTAFDECGNSSRMSYEIRVVDQTDPVAICDQFATVSIKTNGYTDITASAIDDGSFDECGPVVLKIQRMEDPCDLGQDEGWYDKVGFCCEDANRTRMLQLLVTDEGGNTNICMVSVNVQEKVPPVMTCPDHLTVECGFTFDPANADDYFGKATIVDNCPANNTVRYVLQDNRNQCGIGDVVRTFTVSQGPTVYQTCVQIITFEDVDAFYINDSNPSDPNDDVDWPIDYTDYSQCTPLALDPSITGRPVIREDACDLVGVKYEDQLFPFATDNACFKIIRTWTVIDWCHMEQGTHPTWTYEQIIKIVDTLAPELEFPELPIIVRTVDCESEDVTLVAQADDCTPAQELRWSYQITEKGSPVILFVGNTNIVTRNFEFGEYTITYTVEDRCGNVTRDAYDFSIVPEKSPTPICKQGIAVNLVRMNGIPMVMVNTDHIDNESRHNCGVPFVLSFSANTQNTVLTFDCSDLGQQTIQLWATDENGNTAYCETFVDVQDNDRLCAGPPSLLASVTGRITKDTYEDIEGVTVEMQGTQTAPAQTDATGFFAFAPMPVGGAYQIVPTRDGDDLNGVSTLDVVLIQRHILGLSPITNPYRLIAADVNNNQKVTASDIVELRKVLLGINSSFPENTSWRFVDAGFKFQDASNPWQLPLVEKYDISNLDASMELNFIGIKVGDINGNAQGQKINQQAAVFRSGYNLTMEDRFVEKGAAIQIPVYGVKGSMLFGVQAHLNAKGLSLTDITSEVMDMNAGNVALYGDKAARLSAVAATGLDVAETPLFVLEATAETSGWLSDMISLGDQLNPEVYTEGLDVQPVSIHWRSAEKDGLTADMPVPNPWVSQTNIAFTLPQAGMVTVRVTDFTGRKVVSTISHYPAGENMLILTRDDISKPGVYVYELRFEDQIITGKMILID